LQIPVNKTAATRKAPCLTPKPRLERSNAVVTQANIGLTICVPGWTRTIRPPSNFTSALIGYVTPATAVSVKP